VHPNPPTLPLSTRYKGKAALKRPHCSQKYATTNTIRLYGPKPCWLKLALAYEDIYKAGEKSVYLL